MNPSGLLALIEKDLAKNSSLASDCKRIVLALSGFSKMMCRHITFQMLAEMAEKSEVSEVIAPVEYLSGARAGFLCPIMEFIDEDEEIYQVSNADFCIVDGERKFPHPVTGEFVSDFERKIMLSFEVNIACDNIDWSV